MGGRGERTKREGLPAERVRERQLRENARERRKKQLFIECDSGGCGLPHLGADGEPREIGVERAYRERACRGSERDGDEREPDTYQAEGEKKPQIIMHQF